MSLVAALCCSTSLAAVALWKKALTISGTMLAWLCCLIITVGGGLTGFAILLMTFAGTVAADKLAGKRADPLGVRRKSGSRGADRIFCNVGVGTIAMLLYLTTSQKLFLPVFAAVMAESLADSLASKLGPLSKKDPVDIITREKISTGLSGGVTTLGTLSEAAGALLIASLYGAGTGDLRGSLIVFFAGFTGAMFDSVLGSRVQLKYCCTVCGTVTEREDHCGEKTEKISGWKYMSNDMVNFSSNMYSLIISLLLSVVAAA